MFWAGQDQLHGADAGACWASEGLMPETAPRQRVVMWTGSLESATEFCCSFEGDYFSPPKFYLKIKQYYVFFFFCGNECDKERAPSASTSRYWVKTWIHHHSCKKEVTSGFMFGEIMLPEQNPKGWRWMEVNVICKLWTWIPDCCL